MNRTHAAVLMLLLAGGIVPTAARAADKSGARPNVVSVPKGPGSIEGLGESFEANLNSGSVRETIKLSVPPGTAGQAPSLSLSYDSGMGNGPLGIGWTIGSSNIQLKTDRGLPKYDGSEIYTLDGAELVSMGGGVYRLKNEGRFVRVRKVADHFEVDSPDGTLMRYGVSPDARIENGTKIFCWSLEQTVDVFGNRIVFTYVKDRGQIYISDIAYNAREGAADNQITFDYEDRPDVVVDYKPTFPVVTAKRLRQVNVFARKALVRRYRIDYVTSNGLSLVAGVTQVGSDDQSTLPPVAFGYSGVAMPAPVKAMGQAPASIPSPAGGDDELVDVDGDGFPDVLHAATGAHSYYLNEGGLRFSQRIDMAQSPSVALGQQGVETGDLNGDGLVDLIAKTGTGAIGFRFFPNLGKGQWEPSVAFTNNPPFGFEDPNVRMLDFDHDKLVDVVQSTPSGLTLWRNKGDGSWEGPTSAPLPPGNTVVSFSDPKLKMADMNGDGLVDLVYVRDASVQYWPNMGFGNFDAPVTIAAAPSVGITHEGDLQLADVTGDGLTDLLWVDTDHVDYWPLLPSNAYGPKVTLSAVPHRDPSLTTVRFADMNGNGTTDLVWSTPTAAVADRLQYVDMVGEVRPNLLTTIANGLGRVTQLTYSDSGLEYQQARENGKPWTTRVPFSVQVLAESSVSDGLGHAYVTGYSYRDGYYAASTREFRGFAHAEQTYLGDEASPSSIEVHEFDLGQTEEVLKGNEVLWEKRAADGTLYSRVVSEFDTAEYGTGADGNTKLTGGRLRKKTSYQFEATSAPTHVEERFDYDGYGNITVHDEDGAAGTPTARGGSDGRVVTTTYAVDESAWLLRFPATVVTTSPTNQRLAEVHFHYDGAPFEGLPLGQLTRGVLTRKSAWVSGTHFVDLERTQRDPYGNVIATRTPNGTEHTVVFDAFHTFPLEEHVPGPTDWVWSATYDPGLGKTLSIRDPNGATSLASYDVFGRVKAIARPGDTLDAPTEWYEYKLAAPISELWAHIRLRAGTADEGTSISYFDGFGRKLRVAKNAGSAWTVSGVAEYTATSQIIRQYHSFVSDTPTGAPPAGTAIETYSYDAAGRLMLHKRADGKVLRYAVRPLEHDEYDADDSDPAHKDLPRTIRANRREKPYEVVERVRDANGTVRELLSALDYDGEGHVVGVTDANGHHRTLTYDGLGRLIDLEDPDFGHRHYEYDDEGNLVLLATELGTIATTFDGFNRIVSVEGKDPSGTVQSRSTYHYDVAPPDGFGSELYATRLSWIEDDGGSETYRYDLRGNVIGRRRVVEGTTYDLQFTFDDAARMTSVTYPSGNSLEIVADEQSRTTAIPGLLESVTYDSESSVIGMELGNGVSEARGYDALGRLKKLTVQHGSTVLRDATFSYDGRANLLEIADAAAPKLSAKYTYDDLSRVITAQVGGEAFKYQYADDGNFTAINDQPVTYDGKRPHALSGIGSATFQTGPIGALTGWDQNTATYDATGQIRSIATPTGTVKFTYDFSGRLLVEDGPNGKRIFPSAWQDIDDSGSWNVAYLGKSRLARFRFAGEGQKSGCSATSASQPFAGVLVLGLLLIAARYRRSRPALGVAAAAVLFWSGCNCGGKEPRFDSVRYIHHDAVGSANFTTDQDGKPTEMSAYAPFGRPLADIGEHHLFNGRYTDTQLGLSFWPQRALSLVTGRWNIPDVDALEDPASHLLKPQGLNPYVYAANNPINFADSKGAFEEPVHGALTYHLALKAGFTQSEAAQIALACAGVDHNPATAPVDLGNLQNGTVGTYHFASPEVAMSRIEPRMNAGSRMNLTALGVALHTLEDVGFVDALGPHLRGAPIGVVRLLGWFQKGGHPLHITEDWSLSGDLRHVADQPYHDPQANTKELNKIYDVLVRAAQAKHPGVKSDDAAARSLIDEVVHMDSSVGVHDLLIRHTTDNQGNFAASYYYHVWKNDQQKGANNDGVHWSPDEIDSSIK